METKIEDIDITFEKVLHKRLRRDVEREKMNKVDNNKYKGLRKPYKR